MQTIFKKDILKARELLYKYNARILPLFLIIFSKLLSIHDHGLTTSRLGNVAFFVETW